MQAILQSAFLQALTYGLIASVWQMAILWLVVYAALQIFRLSAAQKFNIAFIAQLAGFATFIYTTILAYTSGSNRILIGFAHENLASKISQLITASMPYTSVIYLAVLIFKISRIFFSYNETLHLKKHQLKKANPESRIFVQQVAQQLSLRRKVKIFLSDKVICPLTTGFFKPVILIPLAAVNHLSTEQMEAVILHELVHIKRSDYLLYIIQTLIQKIFFFNIFSLMLNEIIEREREIACDEWVLQFRYNSLHYAEALFKLGRLKSIPALVIPFQGKKESLLLLRVKKLLHNPEKQSINFQSVLLGLMSVFITACLLVSAHVNVLSNKTRIASSIIKNTNDRDEEAFLQTAYISIIQKKLPLKQARQTFPKSIIVANAKKQSNKNVVIAAKRTAPQYDLNQQYVFQVNQKLDSLSALPQYKPAINVQTLLSQEMLQKATSYQNFKRLEEMLTATGNSINVTESEDSKDSYKKTIRIEATDKQGNKHIYNLIVELYQ